MQLCDFVARAEGIEREISGLNGQKAGLYREARGAGFDVATLKAAVTLRRRRAKDPSGYEDRGALLDLYMSFLDAHGEG